MGSHCGTGPSVLIGQPGIETLWGMPILTTVVCLREVDDEAKLPVRLGWIEEGEPYQDDIFCMSAISPYFSSTLNI